VEQEDLLRGIRSALRPGGVAIISTPDKDLDQGDRANPHHVRELSRPEFLNLLREHFESVYLFGQRLAVGSAIWPLDRTMEGTSFERLDSSEDSWSVLSREPEASYLIAVCSDGAEPPPAEASVALDHDITAIRAPQRRLIEAEAELRWLQLPIRSRAIFRTRARLGVIRRRVFRRAR
jgi:SAM-dependent methyltransferase